VTPKTPLTPPLLGGFFAFATLLCAFAGTTLLVPGGPLDALWSVKPDERGQLLALGPGIGAAFLALAVVMALTSYGAFARRGWARRLAIAVFVVNAFGDMLRIPAGAVAQGLVGVAVTAAIVGWLMRPPVRRVFDR